MSHHRHYPLRVPRFAAGIRAQESRTGGGRSWWSQRWRTLLESMGLGARLGRGRNYAMSGQVTSLTIQGPHVTAQVVGARPDPYAITIDFRVPDEAAHAQIAAALCAEPILLARLMADDLPLEVTEIFQAAGYPLFPCGKLAPGVYDMTTHCTCPDYANPCKHSSAVLMLLGEEIARRPLTLLELRGFCVEEFDED